jgi:hypothetical protein
MYSSDIHTPKPTIQIPRSLFVEYGQEVETHKNWKTLRIRTCSDSNIEDVRISTTGADPDAEALRIRTGADPDTKDVSTTGADPDAEDTESDHIIHLNHIVGLGCQGMVYDADSNIYGKVAVKEMTITKNMNPDDVGGIHIIASDLHIGPVVYDICIENDKIYIIFEKLDRMVSFKDMCNPEISYQVCESITKLIENGIFHNDIRSTNIMLTKDNQVRLIDYDMSVQAYMMTSVESTSGHTTHATPLISAKEYDENLKKNYVIFLDEKRYVISFPYEMQERHTKARDMFADLLVRSFIMGVGYD